MNVTMTHKQIPKDIYEDEHPYFTVPNAIPPSVPQSHNWDNKVGEVLVRVKRMEGILVKMSNALATKPQLPPKPTSDRRFSTSDTTVGECNRYGAIKPHYLKGVFRRVARSRQWTSSCSDALLAHTQGL